MIINKLDRAAVIGCGGTGSLVAFLLALSGVRELHLWDDDVVMHHNLSRGLFTSSQVGMKKTEATERIIKLFRPDCDVLKFPHMEKKFYLLLRMADVVFDCTDSFVVQRELYDLLREKGQYQRVGYDGTFLNVSKCKILSFLSPDAVERIGYSDGNNWIVPPLIASALGVFSALHTPIRYMDRIEDIKVKDTTYCEKCSYVQKLEDDGKIGWCDGCDRRDCDNCNICDGCERYDDGYEEGKRTGYEEGYDEGYMEGGKEVEKRGYDEGHRKGYEIGCEEGKKKGFDEGFSKGYDRGYDVGQEGAKKNWYDMGWEDGVEEVGRVKKRR